MASNKFNVALLGSVTAAAMMLAGPVLADEVSDLRAQIEALSQKVQQIETQKAQPAPIPANVVTGGDFPGSFKLPGSTTSWKFGGYAKLDLIYDLDQAGGTTQGTPVYDDATTPTDQDTGVFQAFAGQSRFFFDSRTTTENLGVVRGYFEGHMFGGTFAIRHAYTSFGPWLAGQTWTTYRDLGSMQDTIDFGGPVGDVGVTRQPMLRYTQSFGSTSLQLAIENPTPTTTGTEGDQRNKLPDMIFNLKTKGDWGHISLAGVGQYIEVAQQTVDAAGLATDDSEFGWGLKVAGRINTMGKDNIRYSIHGGDGIGDYAGYQTDGNGVFDTATGKLDSTNLIQGHVGYQHHWNDTWRSNLILGGSKINNPGSAANTRTENIVSLHVNTIIAVATKTSIGIEYSLVQGTDEDARDGQISRVQAMVFHTF